MRTRRPVQSMFSSSSHGAQALALSAVKNTVSFKNHVAGAFKELAAIVNNIKNSSAHGWLFKVCGGGQSISAKMMRRIGREINKKMPNTNVRSAVFRPCFFKSHEMIEEKKRIDQTS